MQHRLAFTDLHHLLADALTFDFCFRGTSTNRAERACTLNKGVCTAYV